MSSVIDKLTGYVPISSGCPKPMVETKTTAPADKADLDAGPQHARLKKATQEFEAVFLGMMLKQMRKSMTGSKVFGASNEAKVYQDMMDETMATHLSKNGSFGLAKTMYQSLARTMPAENENAEGGTK